MSQGFTVGIGEAVGLGMLQELSQEQSSQKKPQRVVESCSDSPPSSAWDTNIGAPYRKLTSRTKASRKPVVTNGLGCILKAFIIYLSRRAYCR